MTAHGIIALLVVCPRTLGEPVPLDPQASGQWWDALSGDGGYRWQFEAVVPPVEAVSWPWVDERTVDAAAFLSVLLGGEE